MIQTIKKFNRLLNPRQKNRVWILFLMMLVGAVLEVLGVSLMLPLMSALMQEDILETNEVIGNVAATLGIPSHKRFVLLCLLALFIIYIVKDLFLMLEYYAQARFVNNNRFGTQVSLLRALLSRPYEYFLSANSGEVMRIIQEDTNQTYNLLTTLLFFATEMLVSIAVFITIFVIDPQMTIFVMIIMGVVMLMITKVVKPIMEKEGLSRQKHYALANKWLLQSISGIKEIKVGHKEKFFESSFEASGKKLAQAERRNNVYGNVPRLMIEMSSVCAMLTVIAILIIGGRDMQSLIPSLSAFVMAAVKLLPASNRIVTAINSIAYQTPALDKMLENIEIIEKDKGAEPIDLDGEAAIEKMSFKDTILLSDITYAYPNSESDVLSGADMAIPVDTSVGIVGASGAGKTTAVDILLGLLAPKGGHVYCDGVDVMENYPGWLSIIGYIPQSIFMLDDTIRANVAFGIAADKISDEQVWHALREAQLEEFIKGLPDRLDTQIGERGIRLSGGQRQRIGIARALYTDPELLIFDEATSSLDNETEAAIMESINSLQGKKTLIIIAHRLQTIENCDIVYRVSDGKIRVD